MEQEPKPDFTIYPTQPADVEAVNIMHNKVWLETYPNEEARVSREWVEERVAKRSQPDSMENRKKFLDDNKDNPDMISRLAKDADGNVIGMTHGYRDENDRQYLGSLYVASDYHGKGVAGALLQEVIAWSDPAEPLYLEVASYNERAKAFYRKWGFVETSQEIEPFAGVVPQVEMVRKGDSQ